MDKQGVQEVYVYILFPILYVTYNFFLRTRTTASSLLSVLKNQNFELQNILKANYAV